MNYTVSLNKSSHEQHGHRLQRHNQSGHIDSFSCVIRESVRLYKFLVMVWWALKGDDVTARKLAVYSLWCVFFQSLIFYYVINCNSSWQKKKKHHDMCDSKAHCCCTCIIFQWSCGGPNGVQGEQQGHVLGKRSRVLVKTHRVSPRSAPVIVQKTQYRLLLLTWHFHSHSHLELNLYYCDVLSLILGATELMSLGSVSLKISIQDAHCRVMTSRFR